MGISENAKCFLDRELEKTQAMLNNALAWICEQLEDPAEYMRVCEDYIGLDKVRLEEEREYFGDYFDNEEV